MGYKRKRKVYRLDFSGTEYEGLEVQVSGLNTGEFLDLIAANTVSKDDSEGVGKMLDLLLRHLVSWNLEDEKGVPLPMTFETLKANDLDFNMTVINAWTSAVADVSAPLPNGSPAGEPSPVASIPMEMLSESPVS